MRSKTHFLHLAGTFDLRPDHHNVRDLIDMCDLNGYSKEADFLRRKLANSGEVTSSVFISPFLDMCFPDPPAEAPIRVSTGRRVEHYNPKPVEVKVYSDGEVVELHHLEGYARFKCAKCGVTTRCQLIDGIGCVYCAKAKSDTEGHGYEFKSERERFQALADHITKERPGLVPVFARKSGRTSSSDTELMREACDDEYAKLPPENASPPVKFHPPCVDSEDDTPLIMNPPGHLTLREIQIAHRTWVQHNFPEQLTDPTRADDGFDGLVEEVGELARARLKARQGIRGTPEFWREHQLDAVGDIIIFLISWCTAHNIDVQSVVEKTWAEVSKRDWKKYPETGVPPKPVDPGCDATTSLGGGKVMAVHRDPATGFVEYLIKVSKYPKAS